MTQTQQSTSRPWVVVLAGLRGAGKTSCLKHLRAKYGPTIGFVEDALAKILREYEGHLEDDLWKDPETARNLECLLIAHQLLDLNIATKGAMKRGVSLVVADRGLFDIEAYGSNRAASLVNTDEASLLALYNQVVFFAPPPLSVWNTECLDHDARRAAHGEIVEFNDRLEAVWRRHLNFVKVDGASWDEKLESALKAILESQPKQAA